MRKHRLVLATALAICSSLVMANDTKHVAVTQIVEHPALDATRQGIQDELAEQGFVSGQTLRWTFESAQGAPAIAAQIAKKFAGEKPDVVVGIATPSAQALASSARNTPLVFSAVTDPVGAKLVKSLQNTANSRVTGVSDLSPIDQHLQLLKTIAPDANKVGVIYNPGEANSAALIELVKQYAPAIGLTVVIASAPRTSDVLTATRSLLGKVDAIYVPTDNTVVSALEAVIKVARRAKIPVIAADTDSVKRGAIAALGFNYYDLGRQTGKIVIQILNGTNPGAIPVQGVEKTELHINPEAAASMGVTLPEDLLSKATKIVKTGS